MRNNLIQGVASVLSQKEILTLVHRYLDVFPYEREHAMPFVDYVSGFDGEDLVRRYNFVGHLTASAMIFNPITQRFLLLKHHSLGLWLQPGGHVERGDGDILTAAQREVAEETGLKETEYVVAEFSATGMPVFEIDSHPIPANQRKNEAAHFHHDIRFLFLVREELDVSISKLESDDYAWFSVEELPDGYNRENIKRKLALL